jgi:hypothetical protein
MRINNREKILLMVLVVVITWWLAFDYLIEPQLVTLSEQKIELKEKNESYDRMKNLVLSESQMDSEIETHFKLIQEVAASYFNTTSQEEYVLLLSDFLEMPFMTDTSIYFNEPEYIDLEGIQYKKDSVILDVNGQYASILNMLKTIWVFPNKIDVSELRMKAAGFDEVEATITLDFYTFVAESGIVDGLYKWYTDDLFYKENPFTPMIENDVVVRYLYLKDDELFNYGQYFEFNDIKGHWMEREINEFLELGYLYLNPYLEFKPDEPMTRGEFIVLVDSVYNWPLTYEDVDLTQFRDYDDLGSLENSFAKAIHRGYLSGFVEGYTDNTLRPRDPITYGEVEFLMNKIKGTTTFDWNTIAESITARKNISESRWSSTQGKLSRAEAVYLLYYFK